MTLREPILSGWHIAQIRWSCKFVKPIVDHHPIFQIVKATSATSIEEAARMSQGD